MGCVVQHVGVSVGHVGVTWDMHKGEDGHLPTRHAGGVCHSLWALGLVRSLAWGWAHRGSCHERLERLLCMWTEAVALEFLV